MTCTGLILMILLELQSVSIWIVHFVGICLLVGRVIHAVNISRENEVLAGRIVGMLLLSHWFACVWGLQTGFAASKLDDMANQIGATLLQIASLIEATFLEALPMPVWASSSCEPFVCSCVPLQNEVGFL